jgi:hypothetical protein
MFCSWRTKIWGLITRIVRRGAESQKEDGEPIILPEGKNPWESNLKRLADERSATELEKLDEISTFVKDLREAAGAVDPEEVLAKKRREADGTVTDIKSWWNLSVATYDPINGKNLDSSDQKKNGRPMNRWRQ